MVNRYMDPSGWEQQFEAPPPKDPQPRQERPPEPGGDLLHTLREKLGGRLPDLNAETLVLLVLVYFLVSDRQEKDDHVSDTLLIIGALLLMGL